MISILYVDDETFLLDVAKAYLEQNNEFQIDTSKSAKEGIEKLKSNNYEAILSDYEMPGMNGIEFLKYVRNSGNTIPFIIFTGHGREEVAIEALNNGADFYIQKGGQPRAQFLELSCKIRQAIERKRIESENKRIISLLSATLESSHDGILAVDLYGKIENNNKKFLDMWHITDENLEGKSDNELLQIVMDQLEEPHSFIDKVNFLYDNPSMTSFDLIRFKDGRVFERFSQPQIIGYSIVGRVWSFKDVTEQKKAESQLLTTNEHMAAVIEELRSTESTLLYQNLKLEEQKKELEIQTKELIKSRSALIESESRYRAVVEDQTEFICRFSPHGIHAFVNDAYCRYFNKSKDEIIGKKFIPDIPDEEKGSMKKHFSLFTVNSPVHSINHRILMDNGEVRWQEWSDRAIFNENGEIIEFQSVGRDITEKKKAEIALKETNRKLNLLSSITRHDLLNTLTSLEGYLELHKDETNEPKMLDYLNKEIFLVKRARNQISFTKMYQDLGVQAPVWHRLDQIIELVQSSNPHSKVNVNYECGSVRIFADPLFLQVFMNLYDNSVRYGGHITNITVSCREEKNTLEIIWSDDGVGIPADLKLRIFEKGFGKNTGYGLFLSREVLAITGMNIHENGKPGLGARFVIQIPKEAYATI